MKLEKALYLSSLFDLYGSLLTKKQGEVFKLYYFDDISLSEIAEISNITKQAVKDTLDKCENLLNYYETNLKLYEKLEKDNSNEMKLEKQTKRLKEQRIRQSMPNSF